MRLTNLSVNKEYQDLLPAPDEREYQLLKQSIKTHGQHLPITVNSQGVILDGHQRFKACKELGIEPKILVRDFEDKSQEFLFVIESNLERRHLTDFQKAELALKKKSILEEIARKNESLGGRGVRIQTPLGRVDVEIGKHAGVGKDTVRRVEKILQSRDEDLIEKVRKGHFTINHAFNKVTRAEKRNALLNEVRNIPFLEQQEKGLKLLNGDFVEQSTELPDSSIDLILTNPPYNEGSIPLYQKLALLAGRVLREGGSLVTYASQFWLPDVFGNMLTNTGIKYWWMFAVKHNGGHQLIYPRNVFVEWKPFVWFVKGERIREGLLIKNMGDLIESEPPDKSLHKLTQSPIEAGFIIDKLTVENQIVLDPFMGEGTFGLAALKLKRQFIGIEIDPEIFGTARTNLVKSKTGAGDKN